MKVWDAIAGGAIDLVRALRVSSDPRRAPKCFVLSLHRSGTRSVIGLCRDLGLKAVHFPVRHNGIKLQPKIKGRETDRDHVVDVLEPVIHRHDSMADVPTPVLYRELDERYPNAKFLLLRRKPANWIRSVRNHIGSRDFHRYERVQYWHYFPQEPQALRELSDGDLKKMCERHFSQVQDYFGKRGRKKFAAFDLEEPCVGRQIGAFLNRHTEKKLPHIRDKRSN